MTHYYTDGSWLKPYGCHYCHPLWFYGSACIPGLLLLLVSLMVIL